MGGACHENKTTNRSHLGLQVAVFALQAAQPLAQPRQLLLLLCQLRAQGCCLQSDIGDWVAGMKVKRAGCSRSSSHLSQPAGPTVRPPAWRVQPPLQCVSLHRHVLRVCQLRLRACHTLPCHSSDRIHSPLLAVLPALPARPPAAPAGAAAPPQQKPRQRTAAGVPPPAPAAVKGEYIPCGGIGSKQSTMQLLPSQGNGRRGRAARTGGKQQGRQATPTRTERQQTGTRQPTNWPHLAQRRGVATGDRLSGGRVCMGRLCVRQPLLQQLHFSDHFGDLRVNQ